MKKFVSFIMAVVMFALCFYGLNLSVLAATTEITGAASKNNAVAIEYDTEYGVTLPSSGTQWFKFTTKNEEGFWYNITVKNISVGHDGVSGEIYDSFGEGFAYAGAFENGVSVDGAKLEPSTTYYVAIYGCRAGKMKFWLNAQEDGYGETKAKASEIDLGKTYESSIDSIGGLTEDRVEDGISGDVDYISFKTGKCDRVRLTVFNSDVDYYNTYFEGLACRVVDAFGSTYCYLQVRPDRKTNTSVELKKNSKYYIKFFSTSGGVGKYKFSVDYDHVSSDWLVDAEPTVNAIGSKHKECTVCGEVIETEAISQLTPVAPKITSVTATAKGVTVKWEAVEGADNYIVYRKTYNDATEDWSTWAKLKDGLTGVDYIDTTAGSGKRYTYTVKATNEAGGSNDASGLQIKFLGTPKLTNITNNTGKVTVKWNQVSGATGYIVYRKIYSTTTKSWSGWARVATTKSLVYNDTNVKSGTFYKYTVKAYCGDYTSYYNTTGLYTKFLGTPKLTNITNNTGKVTVKWNQVSGATGYIVYRKIYSTTTKSWSGWARVATTKSLVYNDTNVKSGTFYKYTVKAYSGDYTGSFDTIGLLTKFLETPTLKTTVSSQTGVKITWDKVQGAKCYEVYRKSYTQGKWSAWSKIATTKNRVLTDKTAKKGVIYRYTVKAKSDSYKSYYNTTGLQVKDKY